MYGAILGDMIGSPYEFDQGEKTKDFELFNPRKWIRYTDDTAACSSKGCNECRI